METKAKRQGGTLDNWYYRGGRVTGTITGDSVWEDGDIIHTSTPINFDSVNSVLETRNTFYALGKPSDIIESDKLPEEQSATSNS